MQFLQINDDGTRTVKGHPGWTMPLTGERCTPEELIAHGFKGLPIVDDMPTHDPATQVITTNPVTDWVVTETAALRTYTVSAKPTPTGDDVNAERMRRILAGTTISLDFYGDIPLQGRDEDRSNLSDLAFAASLRIGAGDTTTTSLFRDRDNVDHALTPPQFIELWTKASAYVSAIYAASWVIKAIDPIPADFVEDENWP